MEQPDGAAPAEASGQERESQSRPERVSLPIPHDCLGHSNMSPLGKRTNLLLDGKAADIFKIHHRLQAMLEKKQRENEAGPLFKERACQKDYQNGATKNRARSAKARLEGRPNRLEQSEAPQLGGPRWGATEGGRDQLKWVRKLVKYTETHPLYVPETRTSEIKVTPGEGWSKTVFPSRQPDRREDIHLLSHWLTDMMKQLEVTAIYEEKQDSDVAEDLANAAVWIYKMAFQELSRQIATECQDRAELLSYLWDQFFTLAELKSAIGHENELAKAQREYLDAEKAKRDISEEKKIIAVQSEKKQQENRREKMLADQQKDLLTVNLVKTKKALDEQQHENKIAEETLKDEVQKRLDVEQELDKTKQLLSMTKNDELTARAESKLLNTQIVTLEAKLNTVKCDLHDTTKAMERETDYSKRLLKEKSEDEIEYQRMRREYETNDIIIMGLKEQLRVRDKHVIDVEMQARENVEQLKLDRCEIQQLKSEISKLQEILADVKEEKSALEEAHRSQTLEFENLRQSSAEKQGELENANEDLSTKLAAFVQDIQVRDHELQRTRAELKDITSKLNNELEQSEGLKSEVKYVRNQLATMAKSMERAAHATGNHTLMKKMTSMRVDSQDASENSTQSGGDRSGPGTAVSASSGANERGDSASGKTYGGTGLHQGGLDGDMNMEQSDAGIEPGLSPKSADGMSDFFSVIELAEKQIKELSAQVKTMERRAMVSESQFKCESDTRQRFQAQMQEAKTERAKALKDSERSRLKVTSLEDELQALKSSNKKLTADVNKRENKLKKLIPECEDLKAQVERLSPLIGKLERLGKENYRLEKERANAHLDLKSTIASREALEANVELLTLEKQELISTKQEQLEEIARLADSWSALEQNHSEDEDSEISEEKEIPPPETRPKSRPRAMSMFGTGDSRLSGTPAALLLKEGSAELRHLISQSVPQIPQPSESSEVAFSPAAEVQLSPGRGPKPSKGASREKHRVSASRLESPRSASPRRVSPLSTSPSSQSPRPASSLQAGTGRGQAQEKPSPPKASLLRKTSSRVRFTESADAGDQPRTPLSQEPDDKDRYVASSVPQLPFLTSPRTSVGSSPRTPTRRQLSGRKSPQGASDSSGTPRKRRFTVPASQRMPPSDDSSDAPPPLPFVEDISLPNVQLATQSSLDKQDVKWQGLKITILSWFARNLRRRLHIETRARLEAQNEKSRLEIEYLKELSKQESEWAKKMSQMANENAQAVRCANILVEDISTGAVDIRDELDMLKQYTTVLASGLRRWNSKFDGRKDEAVQSTDATVYRWVDFVRCLPQEDPDTKLSREAITETIVKIYYRKLGAMDPSGFDDVKSNTIFDAIKDHYTAQRKKGIFMDMLTAKDGPIARLLTSCRCFQHVPKVQMFATFTGVIGNDIVPPTAWHFFLKVLSCLRGLLDVNWKSAVKAWAKVEGATIPLQCVLDLLGNVYNAEQPALLEVVTSRLVSLIRMTSVGPCIDLDAFLMVIMSEHNLGRCPRNPLVYPRRCNDGSLPNLLNLASTPCAEDPPVIKAKSPDSNYVSELPRSPDIFNNFDAMRKSSQGLGLNRLSSKKLGKNSGRLRGSILLKSGDMW
ncbi:hypothetical protein BSKO_13881 [Bryopsis sp. KO-2023]|nr:hypothetical protein BSKO_13881 [Bryopsis sp. KO-2023]